MEHSNSCIHSPRVRRYFKPQFLHDYAAEHLKIYARASSNYMYVLNTCKIWEWSAVHKKYPDDFTAGTSYFTVLA